MTRYFVAFVTISLGVIGVVWWWSSGGHLSSTTRSLLVSPDHDRADTPARRHQPSVVLPELVPVPSRPSAPTSIDSPGTTEDPESQPREFLTHDFTMGSSALEGHDLQGLAVSAEGLHLADSATEGRLVSPAVELDFPSNAVAILWREQLAEESQLEVELSVSPDGRAWSDWQTVERLPSGHNEIQRVFPDGTPNPNFGFVPGHHHVWGLKQWNYVRYRVVLQRTTRRVDSPLLQAVRIYHQDSTLGQGYVAEIAP